MPAEAETRDYKVLPTPAERLANTVLQQTPYETETQLKMRATVTVKTGVPAAVPLVPALAAGEVPLWRVRVNAGVGALENDKLTDVRNLSPNRKIIRLWYRGWESVAKYDAGFPPLPGAEKVYQFDGPLFDQAIMTPTMLPTGSPIGAELLGMINARAIAEKDVHVEGSEPVSFFEYAQPAI